MEGWDGMKRKRAASDPFTYLECFTFFSGFLFSCFFFICTLLSESLKVEEGACAADTKGRNGKASRRIGSVRACRRPVTVQRATGAWPLGPALCFDPPPSLFDLTGAFKKKRKSTKLPKEKEITETPKATLARKNTKRIPLPCRTIIHLHVIRASDFDFDLMLYIFFLKKGHESNKRGKYKKKKR